ncbi:branched-chain amino acid ABC transporter permease [Rhodoligotrophos defluvii]|uniref:branched-chain amino acid ABC transporter permease n=1 Tax=Rhodoligotrophos defluvii TaxID=2561934 RepID=UPI0010C93D2A|nr:branched-chain amino acid ABC transporter permease [Rhodoligotrophos defluvii]
MKDRIGHRRFPDLITALVAATLLALPFVLPSVTLASEIIVYATGALSCALLLGSVGLLSFGQGLYFGFGAYASGILLRDLAAGSGFSVIAATIGGALLAIPIGFLIVRRRGVYFVMLTFAFAQTGFFAMLALNDYTGGENGLSGVPRPEFVSDNVSASAYVLYFVLAALFLAAFLLVQRLRASPLGSVLDAIRSNEGRAEALGYSTRRYKLAAFAIAGGIASLAGAMNTLFLGFVPPSAIDLEMSERLLIMALIGGVGSPAGALLGAGFYVMLADLIGHLWPRWLMIVAVLLILIVLFLRDGLSGAVSQLASRLTGRKIDATTGH